MKLNLIITCANLNSQERSDKYISCFEQVKSFQNYFDSISVLETISIQDCNYFSNCPFDKIYSNIGNPYSDKGYNWARHMANFLRNTLYDNFIFLTGRYKIINDNFIKYASSQNSYKLIAKNEGDIYPHERGVHSFYFYFEKNKLLQFIEGILNDKDKLTPVEWRFKSFMEKDSECQILPKTFFLGLETDISSGIIQKV